MSNPSAEGPLEGIPDPTDRNLSAEDRLYLAVIYLLIEEGADLLAESLKPDDITKRAGKSRASYWRPDRRSTHRRPPGPTRAARR